MRLEFSDIVLDKLSKFTGNSVILNIQEDYVSFTEENSGVQRFLKISGDFDMNISTTLTKSVFNVIKGSKILNIAVENSEIIIKSGFINIKSRIKLVLDIDVQSGFESAIDYDTVASNLLGFADISDGFIITPSGILQSKELVKGYIKVNTKSKDIMAYRKSHFKTLLNNINGDWYENTQYLIREEKTDDYVFTVCIRKMIVDEEDFISYVESLEHLNEIVFNANALNYIFNLVEKPKTLRIVGNTLSVESDDVISLDVKGTADIELDVDQFKSIIKKFSDEIKIKEYEDFVELTNGIQHYFVFRKI